MVTRAPPKDFDLLAAELEDLSIRTHYSSMLSVSYPTTPCVRELLALESQHIPSINLLYLPELSSAETHDTGTTEPAKMEFAFLGCHHYYGEDLEEECPSEYDVNNIDQSYHAGKSDTRVSSFLWNSLRDFSLTAPLQYSPVSPPDLQYTLPPHDHHDSTRWTPSTLGWTINSELLKFYKFIVRNSEEPYFQLMDPWTLTQHTPAKVYLDNPEEIIKGEFPCLYPWGCSGKQNIFSRPTDLERHYKNVHAPQDEKDRFPCGYPKRDRATSAFTRKDHFRDHLRDFHKEDVVLAKGDKKAAIPFTSLLLISRIGRSRGLGWLCLLSEKGVYMVCEAGLDIDSDSAPPESSPVGPVEDWTGGTSEEFPTNKASTTSATTFKSFSRFDCVVLVNGWLAFSVGSVFSAILPALGRQASTQTRELWRCCKCLSVEWQW